MENRQLSQLISRIQSGESAAMSDIVGEYLPRVYGFVAKMIGPGPDAEEITQEVFLRVVRTLGSYQHDGKFTAWIFRIAANLVRDRVRRRRREGELFAVGLGGSAGRAGPEGVSSGVSRADSTNPAAPIETAADSRETNPSHSTETAEDIAVMHWALGQISPEEREAILLRHYSDLPFKDIAELTNCPLGTVLARVHRGLKHLRALMENRPRP